MKFYDLMTCENYPFTMWRSNKGYGNLIVLREPINLKHWKYKSLTNRIEHVLEHIMIGLYFGQEDIPNIKFFQWCPDEGLFELVLSFNKQEPRSMMMVDTSNIQWKYVCKDLKAFEVLYGGADEA